MKRSSTLSVPVHSNNDNACEASLPLRHPAPVDHDRAIALTMTAPATVDASAELATLGRTPSPSRSSIIQR
eukprot:3343958-Pleurochrysis_carterae.AAC.6